MNFLLKFSIAFLFGLKLAISQDPVWSKFAPELEESIKKKNEGKFDLIIKFGPTESTLESVESTFTQKTTHEERATSVQNALVQLSEKDQKSTRHLLEESHHLGEILTLWISNMLVVREADFALTSSISQLPEVSQIDEDRTVVWIDDIVHGEVESPKADAKTTEWGVARVGAPACWDKLCNGTGVKVGIIDTGIFASHEAFKVSYVNSPLTWRDPYNPASTTPSDGHGHGTHCAGTVAGANGTGVAPGANMTICKGLRDTGSGTQSALLDCGQWMLDVKVHIVSNSWGGGTALSFYNSIIKAWDAAGINSAFAAGNSGPNCFTVSSPADSDQASPSNSACTVGAIDNTNTIASYSSRGPNVNGTIKPDICAPGTDIKSAGISSPTSYVLMSGTSMATPHVAGIMALLRGCKPTMSSKDVASTLYNTADRNLVSQNMVCNGTSDTQWPNNRYGNGCANAPLALNI